MEKFKQAASKYSIHAASLLIAIILWIVAYSYGNPITTERIQTSLTITNKDALERNSLMLMNEKELTERQIQIKVSAPSQTVKTIRASSNLKAEIDLSTIDILRDYELGNVITAYVEYTLPMQDVITAYVEYTLPMQDNANVRYDKLTTKVILEIEEIVTKTFNISCRTDGTVPATGYRSNAEAILNPSQIEITGAKRVINSIDSVYVTADLTGAKEDIVITQNLIVMDRYGNDITTEVRLSSVISEVTIPVHKTSSVYFNKPNYSGELAADRRVTNITTNPEYITVVGTEEQVSGIKNLDIPAIDVTGRDASFTQSFTVEEISEFNGLKLGAEVKLAYEEGNEIKVFVTIEKVSQKVFEYPLSEIDISGTELNYKFSDENQVFRVEVLGLESVMSTLDADDISVKMNLSGYDIGTHEISPTVTFSEKIELVSVSDDISIELYDEETATMNAEDTQNATETDSDAVTP